MAHQPSCNDERFNGAINQHYPMPSFWAMSVKWNLAHLPWQEYIIWQLIC